VNEFPNAAYAYVGLATQSTILKLEVLDPAPQSACKNTGNITYEFTPGVAYVLLLKLITPALEALARAPTVPVTVQPLGNAGLVVIDENVVVAEVDTGVLNVLENV
jgi:hypothetical protein